MFKVRLTADDKVNTTFLLFVLQCEFRSEIQTSVTVRKPAIGKAANGRHSLTYTVSKSLRIFLSFTSNARLPLYSDTLARLIERYI